MFFYYNKSYAFSTGANDIENSRMSQLCYGTRELNRMSGFDLKLKLALLVIYLHPWTFPYLAN